MSRLTLSLPEGRCGVAWRFPRRDCRALQFEEPHSHDEFEVYLIMRGHADFLVSGKRTILAPGTLAWIFPEQEHRLDGFSRDFQAWVLVITQEFAAQMASRLPIFAQKNQGKPMIRTIPLKCVRSLDKIAQGLSTGFQPLESHDLGLAWWLASAWNAYEFGDSQNARSLHSAVARAMGLLQDDPARNLKALADETRISPSQLSRLFKRQVGISITDYRNRLRLDTFMERWEAEPEGVMFELAKESGFGSYAQFSRVFRRHMECCPETYQRTNHRRHSAHTQSGSIAALSPSAPL
jgi:AraC-like DNA-binding protein